MSCNSSRPPVEPTPKFAIRPLTNVRYEPTQARLERGRYLSEGVLQCFVCHTDRDGTKPGAPPVAEMKGAGHIWGTDNPGVVAPNLTPDKETGTGNWTDDMLGRAIREGISPLRIKHRVRKFIGSTSLKIDRSHSGCTNLRADFVCVQSDSRVTASITRSSS
jgi:hypothetical protein